jgi:hypothetical protein
MCTTHSRVSISLEVRLKNYRLTCFQTKQAARSQLVSRADPTPLRKFCGAIAKPNSAWFWDPTQQTVTVILRSKSPNWSCWFWGLNRQTIDLGFDAQPRNSHSSSPCARYRSHTTSPDLPIVRPPNTWTVLDYARSSATGLLLLHKSSSLPDM